jgi:hypothetical protein
VLLTGEGFEVGGVEELVDGAEAVEGSGFLGF